MPKVSATTRAVRTRTLTLLAVGAAIVLVLAIRTRADPNAPPNGLESTTTQPPTSETARGDKPIGLVEGENSSYDRSRQPARVMSAFGIRPGQRIADIGAGRGYWTLRLADAVGPTGSVVATDVDDDALASLRQRVAGRANVTVRKAAADEPGLEPGSYDVIVMSEMDHFLTDRALYLTKLRAALAPRGRLAVTHARALREPLAAAAAKAGYVVVGELDDLPSHYLLVFQPTASEGREPASAQE